MTQATVMCEVCSKCKRFANATVNEMHLKIYICDGCKTRLIMERKSDYTLWGFELQGWSDSRDISLERVNGTSVN